MKKTLLYIALSISSLSAFALTEDELVAQFKSGEKSGEATWRIAAQISSKNANDIEPLFNAWIAKDISHYATAEQPLPAAYKKLAGDEFEKQDILRQIYANYLIQHLDRVKDVNRKTAILCGSSAVYDILAESDPNLYSTLKSADFVIDGHRLPYWTIDALVRWANDTEFYLNLSVEEGMKYGDYVKFMSQYLLKMSDVEAAKQKCQEIENYMLNNGMFNSAQLVQIQAISKVLTARLVDSKILNN